jgi:DNA-binding CsgD family transcriptional regulator
MSPSGSGPALTPRQREILSLIADGLSNKQIARQLQINEQTVKNAIRAIYLRLGARNRAHAVALWKEREG